MYAPNMPRSSSLLQRLPAVLIGVLAALSAGPGWSAEIQSRPLALGNDVPNNLVLIPSVEFPTILSQANFDYVNGVDTYQPSREYVGYFDPNKCYTYVYNQNEKLRRFEPVRNTSSANHVCNVKANKEWSGNFMNWAATQTIDPFRKALTGGYRVRDTPSETWLEKAVSDDHAADAYYFDNKYIKGADAYNSMPIVNSFAIRMRIHKLRNQMYFTMDDGRGSIPVGNSRVESNVPVAYNPADPTHGLNGANPAGTNMDDNVYAVSARVAVCVERNGVSPEANCKKYAQGWKPEGLVQKYNAQLRYSIFGYLNDSSSLRDGGVLRARQKYVGPYTYDPVAGQAANSNAEWDATTGVQKSNPDATDATATNTRIGGSYVTNSGVINYLNKFGQTTAYASKGLDNVSELYYAAVRYFKNLGDVPEYSAVPAGSQEQMTDLFPVIADWANPIQYQCQRNVAVGIGDTNTHLDRNLPGSKNNLAKEPARPAKVASDQTVDVQLALQKVFDLEGITNYTGAGTYVNTTNHNSAFIAGLAYDSHTKDLQPLMPGMQTLSTYWVDVMEGRVVATRANNQYYLAAKYGGFDVPEGFDPYTRSAALPDAWWTDGDKVGMANQVNEKRPRNFFVAYQADQMVKGLTRAFESAVADRRGAAAAVGINGAAVQDGAVIYAPTYYTDWRGELTAYRLDPATRTFSPLWTASEKMPAPAQRKIFANSGGYRQFRWSVLSAGDQSNLTSIGFANATGQDVVDYLRGERSKEAANGGPLRNRKGVIGDLVDSTPLYVGRPNAAFYANAGFAGGGDAYRAFADSNAARRAVVYVGANDGMLHGFDAATGEETYAFVPQSVLARSGMDGLAGYASPNYQHRFFVDGELTVADVYTQGSWKTVLIGTLGRGGRGVFALDITDPGNVKFLWELSGAQVPGLGNNLGKPWVAQTASGVWKVFLGNGPNSDGGRAQLLMLDVATGAATSVDTGVGGDNGLSAARVWDADNDGFVDTAYAGDMKGNLWKFAGLGGAGGSAAALRLFEASANGKAQPIMATPLVGRKPDSLDTWVFFGTGSFLNSTDLGNKAVQSWYGIVDKGRLVTRGELAARSIEFEGKLTRADGKTSDVRVISAARDGDMTGKNGWYLDLVSPGGTARGERIVVPNLFDGNRLLGISRIPNVADPCSPGGDGFIMEIDPFTGARTNGDVFDANGDGRIDGSDRVATGGGDGKTPVSGVGTEGNSPNGGVLIPGNNGNVIPVQNDSGGLEKPESAPFGLGARRISWREVRRDN